MTVALVVGLPQPLLDALPAEIEVTEGPDGDAAAPADVIVVGPDAESPLLLAQRLSRHRPGSELVLVAGPDRLGPLREQLRVTPFVPLGTRVVSSSDRAAFGVEMREALSRHRHRRDLDRNLRTASAALSQATKQTTRPPSQPRATPVMPLLSDDEHAEVRAFFAFYEPRRGDVGDEVRAMLHALPKLRPIVDSLTPEQQAERERISAELQRAAVLENRWLPYLDDLRNQGIAYARLGMSFGDWFEILMLFRRSLVGRLFAEPPDDVRAVLLGMDRFLDIAMVGIGQAYVEATGDVLREHRERERLYISLVESSDDAIVSHTMEGTLTAWNPAAERIYGYTAAEAIGRRIDLIVPKDRRAELQRVRERLARGEHVSQLETLRVTKDGRLIDVALTFSPLTSEEGVVLGAAVVARDITRRKEAERALALRTSELREVQARRAAALDGALDAIVTIDHEGVILEFNPAAERLFGYALDEVAGRQLADVIVPAAMREAHRAGLGRFRETGEGRVLGKRLELPALRRSGEEFPAEVSIVRLEGTDPPVFTGFIRDLSDLERAETQLRERAEELARSNAELEQFAYVASHDLQEPLRMVASYVQLLDKRYRGQLDDKADKYIHYAVDGATRMQQLIDDLLAYSRVGTRAATPERVELSSVVAEALRDLSAAIENSEATIEVGDLPVVQGARAHLRQLFQNLIGNALKFRGPDPPVVHVDAVSNGDFWAVRVRDNGIGIDPEFSDRIFEVFSRLHERERYPGSGIGLAIARKIVERHGGRIWVESSPGDGATFGFTLPKERTDG